MRLNIKAVVAAAVVVLTAQFANAAIITSLTDDFNGTSVDLTKWNITNRGLENNGPAGYNVPSETGGTLTLGGTTSGTYWYGSSLESVNSFSSAAPTLVEVDRVSLSGSGSAWRLSLWLYGDSGNFIHFAENTENGWEFNCNGCNARQGRPEVEP